MSARGKGLLQSGSFECSNGRGPRSEVDRVRSALYIGLSHRGDSDGE